MEKVYKSFSFSKFFLFLVLGFHLIFYFFDQNFISFLALNPHLVIYEVQIWRLFTFPFLPLSIAESFLFFYVFWFLAPKVEITFKRYFFPLSLCVFILLQGFLTVGLLGKENFYLYGTEGLSFYILTLYLLIYLRIISQYEPLPWRNLTQISLVVFFWLMAAGLDSFVYNRSSLINSFSFALVGIFVGSLGYLQNRAFAIEVVQQRYRDFLNFRKHLEELELKEELFSSKSHPESDKPNEKSDTQNFVELVFDEDNLNRILDKIIEKGKESLTPEEIKFLENYSKKVK